MTEAAAGDVMFVSVKGQRRTAKLMFLSGQVLDEPAIKPVAARPAKRDTSPVRKAATIAAAVNGRRGGPVGRLQAGLATAMAEDPDWKEF